MSKAGCLEVVLQKILTFAKSTGDLIASTVASCITMGLCTGNSYLSILIPGEMFRDAYKARGLAAKNLSRTLEDAGTVFVPLVPGLQQVLIWPPAPVLKLWIMLRGQFSATPVSLSLCSTATPVSVSLSWKTKRNKPAAQACRQY